MSGTLPTMTFSARTNSNSVFVSKLYSGTEDDIFTVISADIL